MDGVLIGDDPITVLIGALTMVGATVDIMTHGTLLTILGTQVIIGDMGVIRITEDIMASGMVIRTMAVDIMDIRTMVEDIITTITP